MGSAGAEAVIPLAAVVGILFALWQWFVVSRVKISGYYQSLGTSNGYHGGPVFEMDRTEEDALEGSTDERVIMAKCAEIQHAISVGVYLYLFPFPFIFSHFSVCFTSSFFFSNSSLYSRFPFGMDFYSY